MKRTDVAEHLERHSVPEPNSGCTLWLGGQNRHGYGYISIGGRTVGTHRAAYELAHGPVSAGLVIRHHCDNPPCINPNHLTPGTRADNSHDMRIRGRQGKRGAASITGAVRLEVTRAQRDWLRAEKRRLGLPMEVIVSRAIQAAMDAEQQQERAS
jgi:hypothetical protein